MALRSQTDEEDWEEMGSVFDNENDFPLYGYFKDVVLNQTEFYSGDSGDKKGGGGNAVLIVFLVIFVIAVLVGGIGYYFKKKRNKGEVTFKEDGNSRGIDGGSREDLKADEEKKTGGGGGYDMAPINTQEVADVETR